MTAAKLLADLASAVPCVTGKAFEEGPAHLTNHAMQTVAQTSSQHMHQ